MMAQDLLPSSLNVFNKYRINPAYGGLSNHKILSVGFREQWNGLESHPKQLFISYNQPFYNLFGGGGISISSESKGIKNIFQIKISYNYVYSGYAGLISVGGALSMDSYSKNVEKIITPEGQNTINGIYQKNDTYLDRFLNDNSYFSGLSGFVLYNNSNFEFGIVFDKKINVADVKYQTENILKLNLQYSRKLTTDIYLKVFGVLYSDFYVLQNEMSFVFNYKNILGGFGVRGYSKNTLDSFFLLIGGNINESINMFYGYDLSLSGLRNTNSGVHEIKLIYNFGNAGKNINLPPIIYTPRL